MLEIACDESGYEGQRLIGATTDVFAHGSVAIDRVAADECMAELRRRIQSPATMYKATHLLREKHRSVLEWLLGGPLTGRGHVFLIDKAYYVLSTVVSVLAPGSSVVELCRAGRTDAEPAQWQAFLAAANDLLRTKDIPDVVSAFYAALDRLDLADPVLEALRSTKSRAEEYRAQPLSDPAFVPALDPLIPSLLAGVRYWGPAIVVHDRQTTLTPERVAYLRGATSGRLAGVRLADSFHDCRVQLADVLAGTARKIASQALNGRGDPRLTRLLASYVDENSIWGDAESWARISP
jgi:hypothetical protein